MSEGALLEAMENYKQDEDIPEVLEQFFIDIARTGFVPVPWSKMQKLFISKLNKVVEEFYKTTPFQPKQVNKHCEADKYEDMKERLGELVLTFDEPPFTIQRLCELLTQPRKNYTKCDKFMRGIEKNLMVVSSWTKATDVPNNANRPYLNGIMPSKVDHTMIPSPVSVVPPKVDGAFNFADTTPATNISKSNTVSTDSSTTPKISPPSKDTSEDKENIQSEAQKEENKDINVTESKPTENEEKMEVTSTSPSKNKDNLKTSNILGKRKSESDKEDVISGTSGSNDENKETDAMEVDSSPGKSPTKRFKAEETENLNKPEEAATTSVTKSVESDNSDNTITSSNSIVEQNSSKPTATESTDNSIKQLSADELHAPH